MPKDTPQVEHKAEALRLLEWVGDPTDVAAANADDPRVEDVLAVAQIRSNLAIAEGQERVAKALEHIFDRLDDLTEVDRSPSRIGDGPRHVRTRNV